MTDLLGSGSDSDSDNPSELFKTDNSYAAKYDQWRGKEHLQKLKDKYGENYDGAESEESDDDEEEDEDADELTAEIEKDFFTTLASLKKGDPKIYDGKTVFFKDNASKKSEKGKQVKAEKITLGDIERKVMLEKDGKFEELEDDNINIRKDKSYNEEMQSIKESFRNALDSEEVDDDLLMRLRNHY